MKKLTAANSARANKALDKLYNFSDYGVTSFRKLIEKEVFVKSKEELEPALKYNRKKFNYGFNNQEAQDEYYRRCTEKTKKAYYLYYDDRISTQVSKFVFDYYNEKQAQEHCIDCNKKMTEMDHNYGTEDYLVCIHCYNEAQEVKQLLMF